MYNKQQPRQRLPYKQKDREWRKDNIDFSDTHSFYYDEFVRQTLRNKVINLNLYNGIVDVRDLTSVVNPNHLEASYVPDNIPHNPIVVPKIDLLVGEESKRRFDFSLVVTNPDAITKKEDDKKKFLMQKLAALLEANYKDEELKTEMDKLGKYMKYSWQDIREKMGNQIIKHYYQEEDFARKFLEGFKNALIMAEEIYLIDISHNEPTLTVLNPLKVQAIGCGNSNRFEDASIILMEDHKAPSQLVDEYFDELKPEEIDQLMDYQNSTGSEQGTYNDDYNNHNLLFPNYGLDNLEGFGITELNGHTFNSNFTDEHGNVRELKVRWRSLRKVKKIKFYDEYGETQYRFESEEYIRDKNMGEEESIFWISEGWEGIKLGKDIYLKMKPLDVQYTKANNPSRGHLGVIGQIYNTNQGRAVSFMDRAKNLQYLYDVMLDRLNKAISTNYGKIMELDLAKVPANWEIDKWMHFAVVNKIAVVDSFKEGNHGASTGKLAGSTNNIGGRAIDMETGAYIQQHIQLLAFIKEELGEICGVSRQREGQISNRETVGGVEKSVNQSSHITEYWFSQHESVKLRVITAFMEAAKHALRSEGNKKVQYILDDQTIEILNMEGETFAESDYGLLVTSTSKTMELEQAIKQYAQAFIQNGGSMSTIMDIYFSPSLQDMRRKLENAEEEIHQRNSQQADAQNKIAQEQMIKTEALEQQKLKLEEDKSIRDDGTKRYIAELSHGKETETTVDTNDESELDRDKFNLDAETKSKDFMLKARAQDLDMIKHNDQMELGRESNQISRIQKKKASA